LFKIHEIKHNILLNLYTFNKKTDLMADEFIKNSYLYINS